MLCEQQFNPKGNKVLNLKKLSEQNASEQMRIVRGYAIISKGDTPKQLDKNTFEIPSQNGNGVYTVKNKHGWECTCPDFQNRKKPCKHIHSVKLFFELTKKVKTENKGIVAEKQKCPYCNSSDTIGYGKRKCKDGVKQRYMCRKCKRYFIEEKDFQRYKGNGKVTTLILDLYFKGISLRSIKDHLNQFYNISLDHSNILRRIQKFSKVIDDYVKTLKPEVSEQWHIDEMQIRVGKKWKWLWNMMDERTKFLITRKVTTRTRQKETREFFKEGKEQAQKEPIFMITDGRHSYTRSLKKEMPTTNHIRLKTIRDKRINNNNIERLNLTVRDRLRVMKGLCNTESAELMTSAFQNYYNFIRLHTTIGTTPAEKSGINFNLGKNRWLSLLKLSFKNKN